MTQDLTGRKAMEDALARSERNLRHLTESVRLIPWQADASSGQFTYVGPQAEQILGYPSQDWLADDFWESHIHPGIVPTRSPLLANRAIAKTTSPWSTEWWPRTAV